MGVVRRLLLLGCLLGGLALAADLNSIREMMNRGEVAGARLLLQKAIADQPRDGEPRVLLARVLYLEGKGRAALAELERVSAEHWTPEAFWIRGLALADLGRSQEALADLRAAAYFGNEYQYMMDWGTTAWRFGRLEVAQEAFRFAQALQPDQPWPFLNAGMVLFAAGKMPSALQQLEQGLKVLQGSGAPTNHPAYPELYYWQGRCHEDLGNRSLARTLYRKAVEVDPDFIAAAEALSNLRP